MPPTASTGTTAPADRPRRPPLTPYPIEVLLGRIAREWETRRLIFDLPPSRMYHAEPAHDLSFAMGGRRPATPFGPAAGPHTQLAQNYVLGWLAGARVFECKTVQVLDQLEIARPCIDMEAVGYNIEWSQELTLEQSLVEYVTAWMLLGVLGEWEPLRAVVGDPGEHLFDLSVGYDLAGIRSPQVDRFIRGMRDATTVIDELRPRLPTPFERFRDHPFEPRIATTATLSTFHGCPPDEIDAIARHLMDTYDLDVIVKLNPTLLGHTEVDRILHDVLGYDDVRLDPDAFAADLAFDTAVDELIPGLADYARSRSRRFGVKLTNTLVVHNDRGVLPDEPMYLSGAPLHVISMTLLDRLVEVLSGTFDLGPNGGDVQVSWSAGIDATNVADAAGLGLRPVTVCSDLLQPGGYGHLHGMLRRVHDAMTHAAVTDLPGWIADRHEAATAAGHRDAVAAYVAELAGPAGVDRYGAERVETPRRQLDRTLEPWGCVACNLCVNVCPNDAMLHVRTPSPLADELPDRWQYLCLAELCNECGNCTTFCPEDGAPWLVKPRLFLTRDRYDGDADRQGALLAADDDRITVAAVRPPGDDEQQHVTWLQALLDDPEGVPLRGRDLPRGR